MSYHDDGGFALGSTIFFRNSLQLHVGKGSGAGDFGLGRTWKIVVLSVVFCLVHRTRERKLCFGDIFCLFPRSPLLVLVPPLLFFFLFLLVVVVVAVA